MGKKKKDSKAEHASKNQEMEDVPLETDNSVLYLEPVESKRKKLKKPKENTSSENSNHPDHLPNTEQTIKSKKRKDSKKNVDGPSTAESDERKSPKPSKEKKGSIENKDDPVDPEEQTSKKCKKKKRKTGTEETASSPDSSAPSPKNNFKEAAAVSCSNSNVLIKEGEHIRKKSKKCKKTRDDESQAVKSESYCCGQQCSDALLEDITAGSLQQKIIKDRKKKKYIEETLYIIPENTHEMDFFKLRTSEEADLSVRDSGKGAGMDKKQKIHKRHPPTALDLADDTMDAVVEEAQNLKQSDEMLRSRENKKKIKKNKEQTADSKDSNNHPKEICEIAENKKVIKEKKAKVPEVAHQETAQHKGRAEDICRVPEKNRISKKKKTKALDDEVVLETAPHENHADDTCEVPEKKRKSQKRKNKGFEEEADSETTPCENCEVPKKKRKSKEAKELEEAEQGTKPHEPEHHKDCSQVSKKEKKKKIDKMDIEVIGETKAEKSSKMSSQDDRANDTNTSIIPPSPTALTTGRWNTSNMFESSDRQLKFLRLLGGLKKGGLNAANNSPEANKKKGLFGSLQACAGSGLGSQAALTYQAAQEMNKRLESDFDKALGFSVRSQRGVGLGFTPDPAEGKKFHININKSTSKKFDD